MQADAGGGSGRTDATLTAAAGRTYTELLRLNKPEINALKRDITDAKTPAIRDAKTKELADLEAKIQNRAREIIYAEDAPSAAAPPVRFEPGATNTFAPKARVVAAPAAVNTKNPLLN